MITAVRGLSAFVAIDVALALAVSWKPLVKSNASAVTMTTTTISERSMGPVPGFDVLAGRYGPSANAR